MTVLEKGRCLSLLVSDPTPLLTSLINGSGVNGVLCPHYLLKLNKNSALRDAISY